MILGNWNSQKHITFNYKADFYASFKEGSADGTTIILNWSGVTIS